MNDNLQRLINDANEGKIVLVTSPEGARMIHEQFGDLPIHVEPLVPRDLVCGIAAEDFKYWKHQLDKDKSRLIC